MEGEGKINFIDFLFGNKTVEIENINRIFLSL